jgi:hypothetical protein
MSSPSTRSGLDPHSRRLLVDEVEWRDRLNQLADMRRVLSAAPAAGPAMMTAPDSGQRNATETP